MKWHYAQGNQQLGPVSEEELNRLVQQGTVSPQTLVWREGMSDWVPYSTVSMQDSGSSGAGIVCAECGVQFRFEDVVRFGESYVCAACKPVAMQRVQASGGFGDVAGTLSPEQLTETDYDSPVLDCIGRGFKTYLAGFFPILGTTILLCLCTIPILLIPLLGILIVALLAGPFLGGYWNYLVCRARGETTRIGDAFSGFNSAIGNLILGQLVTSMIAGLALIPGIAIIGFAVFSILSSGIQPSVEAIMASGAVLMLLVGAACIFLGWLVFIYFSTCWLYTLPLIADKRIGFWSAMGLSRTMVHKHWWSNFGIGFVFHLISNGGAMLIAGIGAVVLGTSNSAETIDLIVGVCTLGMAFLGVPWFFSSYAHRYNDVFCRLAVQNEF